MSGLAVRYNPTKYQNLKSKWKSGNHVGDAKPKMRGYVRTTRIKRFYGRTPADEVYGLFPGLPKHFGPRDVWKGKWKPATEWQLLPNIKLARGDQDFDSNGVQTCTVTIDNIGEIEHSSVSGIWHTFQRGYYSPFRGYNPDGRRPKIGVKNEWYDVLNDKSTEIMIVAGYGEQVVPVFNGLVNDCDMTSKPDEIVLTCRDAGQLYTDQRVMINAKARYVPDPIVFADRLDADDTERVALGARASDHRPGDTARFVLDDLFTTNWISEPRSSAHPDDMPWIEIDLPHGRYESFTLEPCWGGAEVYVAILSRDRNAPGGHGGKEHVPGSKFPDNSWVDEGKGNVPGTGIPYVRHIKAAKLGLSTYSLEKYGYDLGDGSKIRLYFTNLDRIRIKGTRRTAHHAGVRRFNAVKRKVSKEAVKANWILVDDLSDVVKIVFQWIGLNAFEVESTGVRIKGTAVFNRGNFLLDIIKHAAEQVGYVFYVKPPYSFDESPEALANKEEVSSMGIGVFRSNQALRRQGETLDPVELVHEDQTLQGIEAKLTDEPLANNIFVRGREIKHHKKQRGRILGEDRTYRFTYVYRPPWSRDRSFGPAQNNWRNGNIKKYEVYHNNYLQSMDECKVAAILVAFQQALAAAQATFEAPCLPTVQLDHQIAVFDTGTALSTRLWVVTRQWEFDAGEQGHFKMGLGGSLIDLPDIQRVRRELVAAIKHDATPGLGAWVKRKWGRQYRNDPVSQKLSAPVGGSSEPPPEEEEPTYAERVAALSPYAYWPLQADSDDASGNSRDGIDTDITHAQAGPTVYGEVLKSAAFNGSTSKIASGFNPYTGSLSYAAWVNIDALGAWHTLFANSANWAIGATWVEPTGKVESYFPGGDNYSEDDVTSGSWHHVAVCYGSGQVVTYIDGVAQTAKTFSAFDGGTGNFQVGSDEAGDLLDGRLSQVVLVKRVLTLTEVRELAGLE